MNDVGPLILSYLSAEDLLAAGDVCRAWQRWSDEVWRKNFVHPRRHYRWLARRCKANDFCIKRKNKEYTRVGMEFLMATFHSDDMCGIVGAMNYFDSLDVAYYGFSFLFSAVHPSSTYMIHLFPNGVQSRQKRVLNIYIGPGSQQCGAERWRQRRAPRLRATLFYKHSFTIMSGIRFW